MLALVLFVEVWMGGCFKGVFQPNAVFYIKTLIFLSQVSPTTLISCREKPPGWPCVCPMKT